MPLHLVRALADLEDLLVAVEPRDRELVHEAVAAVDLERRSSRAVRQLARVELRHRGLAREVAALVLQPRGAVDERAAGLDLRRHVASLNCTAWNARSACRTARAPARTRTRGRSALREPDAHRRDRDPAAVEDLEELRKPCAARPEQVPLRHARVLEREPRACRRPANRASASRRDLVPRRAVRDDDVRDLVSPVTAVTVTHAVMSVPAFVMNIFEPLFTHSPSRSSARCPGCARVRARLRLGQPRTPPTCDPTPGRAATRAFCSSVPNRKIAASRASGAPPP
jgi:hypothetical protein